MFKQHFTIYERAITNNIENGKAERIYQGDVDEQLIAKLLVSRFEKMPKSDTFTSEEYTSVDFLNKTCSYYVRGITTPKGIDLFKMCTQND